MHGYGGTMPPAFVLGPRTAAVRSVVRLLHAKQRGGRAARRNVLQISRGRADALHRAGCAATLCGSPSSAIRVCCSTVPSMRIGIGCREADRRRVLLSGVAVTALITDRLWVAGAFAVLLLALALRAGQRARNRISGARS